MKAVSSVEAPQGVVDAVVDIDTARRELQASRDREILLRNELAHRVRNILAITRSLFSRTIETSDTLDDAADHFRGRLDALARYHARTASAPQATFDLESMVFDELLTVTLASDPRVSAIGPEVRLRETTAEMMGLALHELATNSIKFGVLAEDEGSGRLCASWTIDGSMLAFEWAETGVSIIAPAPRRSGFGRELIEQALPFQLGAETSFTIVPGGLVVRIRLPLPPRSDEAQATAQDVDDAER